VVGGFVTGGRVTDGWVTGGVLPTAAAESIPGIAVDATIPHTRSAGSRVSLFIAWPLAMIDPATRGHL
jgi:hypothetical protein